MNSPLNALSKKRGVVSDDVLVDVEGFMIGANVNDDKRLRSAVLVSLAPCVQI